MRLLKKRWHSIPVVLVAVVLALALTTGGVLAAYSFTGMSVTVEVDEPLQVQYNLKYVVHDTENPGGRTDSTGWQDMPAAGLEAYFSAGDAQTLYLRMNNRANSPLTVSTIIASSADVFAYSWSDFPQNEVIPVSNGFDFGSATKTDAQAAEWTSGAIPISIKGDAAPGSYGLSITFTRE